MSDKPKCERCSDDGWIDVNDDDGNVIGARDCPHQDEPWHPEFNASGLLADRSEALSSGPQGDRE